MPHVRIHPPRTTAIDRDTLILSGQNNGECVDERFADLVTLGWTTEACFLLRIAALFDGVFVGRGQSIDVLDAADGVELVLYGLVVVVELAGGRGYVNDSRTGGGEPVGEKGLAHVPGAPVVYINDLACFLGIFLVILIDSCVVDQDVGLFDGAEERLY